MTPSQIIMEDARRQGFDPNRIIRIVSNCVKSGRANILHRHNTVLLLIHLGDHTAEVHIFTVDPVRTMMDAIRHFIQVIKQTGVSKVYGKADNPGIVQALSSLGLNVQQSDRPEYNFMATE
jgi:hypothetical protein